MRKALLDSFIWRGTYFITTLLLNVCIARIFEAKQSGWIYFISNNFYLVLLVAGLSLDAGMTFFSSSKKIADNKLAMFSVMWSLVVGLVSVLCTVFFVWNNAVASSKSFLIIAGLAYTFGNALTSYFTSLFYARQNFKLANRYMSAVNIGLIAFLLINTGTRIISRDHFLYIYFIQFIVQGFGLFIIYRLMYLKRISLQLPSVPELRQLFNYSLVALTANTAGYLINRVDYFFVEAWCTPNSLGNYVQVSKMGQLFMIIPSIISSAIYPMASRGESGKVGELITRLIIPFLIFFIAVFVLAALFSNPVFLWLFGPTFNEMYLPFLWLIPGIFFLSLHSLFAAYFGGTNKPVYNFISATIGLVVVLAGDVLFIKKAGIIAAAIVSSAGYITTCSVSFALFYKNINYSFRDIFNKKTLRLSYYTSVFTNQSTSVH